MTVFESTSRVAAACASLGLLVLAGCGGSESSAASNGDQVASLQTDDSVTDAASAVTESTVVSADEAALEFSQCLRDQGLDVADIGVDSNGNIDVRSALDNVDPGDSDFRDAMDACRDILSDAGFGGGQRGGDFDDTALQDAFLEFSDCIRDQGFEDVPDLSFEARGGGRPGSQEDGGDEGTPPGDSAPAPGQGQRPDDFGDRSAIFADRLGLDPDDPEVIAALDECSPILDNAFSESGPGAQQTAEEG